MEKQILVPGTNSPFNAPNNSIYIQNLPERMRLVDLKRVLIELFKPYGDIISIHCKKNIHMRGQAFIAFSHVDSAMRSVEEMQGFPLWFKPMHINYARFKSHTISKQDGTFDEEHEKQMAYKREKSRHPRATRRQVMQQLMSGGGPVPNVLPHVPSGELPNKLLFVQNLPQSVQEIEIRSLFRPYAGFRDVRLVPGKADIAFVEFETEIQATVAKNALDRYKITDQDEIKITYARR